MGVWLLATAVLGLSWTRAAAAPPAACAALMSKDARGSVQQNGTLPGLAVLREAILSAAQESGRQDVSCDPVSKGSAGEVLQCYNGNSVAIIGQSPRLLDGTPLLVASFGDGVERKISKDGIYINGSKKYLLEGSPLISALRAQQLFCESVVSGDQKTLLLPIDYTPPKQEAPRTYSI